MILNKEEFTEIAYKHYPRPSDGGDSDYAYYLKYGAKMPEDDGQLIGKKSVRQAYTEEINLAERRMMIKEAIEL